MITHNRTIKKTAAPPSDPAIIRVDPSLDLELLSPELPMRV